MKSVIRFNRNIKGIECLNCKQPISDKDNFCSNCGQVNDLQPLSIKQYLREFFSGFFAFDTRTLNTIIPLLFKPGKVSIDYINGKRMQYVNPFQLYLHTSIIFFLVIGMLMSMDKYDSLLHQKKKEDKEVTNKKEVKFSNGFLKINLDSNNSFKDTIGNKKETISNDQIRALIANKVDSIINDTDFKTLINDTITNKDKKLLDEFYYPTINRFILDINNKFKLQNDSLNNLNTLKDEFIRISEQKLKEKNSNYTFGNYAKKNIQEQLLQGVFGESIADKISIFSKVKTNDVIVALDSLDLPRTKTNIFLFLKTKELKGLFKKNSNEKRSVYLQNSISKISIVLFFLLPFFTLFMRLLYIRRKFNYTEHLIFIFNLQTVFFILLLLAIISDKIFQSDIFLGIAIVYFGIYLFLAMKRFYQQGNFKTLVKYFLTFAVYNVMVLIGTFLLSFLFALVV